MEDVLAHLQDNMVGYGIGAVCLAPIIYVTRKYSVPFLLYIVEFLIYSAALHLVSWVLVVVTKWFKESSSMRALREDGRPEDAPEWATPLLEFWKTEEYNPNWIWKAELAALVIVLVLMWRYRPMKIQRKPKRATQEFAKGKYTPGGGRTGAGGKAGGRPGSFRGPRGR